MSTDILLPNGYANTIEMHQTAHTEVLCAMNTHSYTFKKVTTPRHRQHSGLSHLVGQPRLVSVVQEMETASRMAGVTRLTAVGITFASTT